MNNLTPENAWDYMDIWGDEELTIIAHNELQGQVIQAIDELHNKDQFSKEELEKVVRLIGRFEKKENDENLKTEGECFGIFSIIQDSTRTFTRDSKNVCLQFYHHKAKNKEQMAEENEIENEDTGSTMSNIMQEGQRIGRVHSTRQDTEEKRKQGNLLGEEKKVGKEVIFSIF